jgi:hypothetical protein
MWCMSLYNINMNRHNGAPFKMRVSVKMYVSGKSSMCFSTGLPLKSSMCFGTGLPSKSSPAERRQVSASLSSP